MTKKAKNLSYWNLNYDFESGIRNIAQIYDELKKFSGKKFKEYPLNIGDPICWEKTPEEVKLAIKYALEEVERGRAKICYGPSSILPKLKEVLIENYSKKFGLPKKKIDDIYFDDGTASLIKRIMQGLNEKILVLIPVPSYPAQVGYAGKRAKLLETDPKNWKVNLNELEKNLKNPKTRALAIINPHNPTSIFWEKEYLAQVFEILRKINKKRKKEEAIFVIGDETYEELVFPEKEKEYSPLIKFAGDDIPLLSIGGISKSWPATGLRGGWVKAINFLKNDGLKEYWKRLLKEKQLTVCPSTFVQEIVYQFYTRSLLQKMHKKTIEKRITKYQKYVKILDQTLKKLGVFEFVNYVHPKSGFYSVLTFKDGILKEKPKLKLKSTLEKLVFKKWQERKKERKRKGKLIPLDELFCYYLFVKTGIALTPLTAFYTKTFGARLTLLLEPESLFEEVCQKLSKAILEYVESN